MDNNTFFDNNTSSRPTSRTPGLVMSDDKLLDEFNEPLNLGDDLAKLLPLFTDLDWVCGTSGAELLRRGGSCGPAVIEAWRRALGDHELVAVDATSEQGTRTVWRLVGCQVQRPTLNWQPGVQADKDDLYQGCVVRDLWAHELLRIEMLREFLDTATEIELN